MKLKPSQRAKFGVALDPAQQSKIDATISRTRQIEDLLRNYIEWTPKGPVQMQYDALGQILQVKIDPDRWLDDQPVSELESELVRVFDAAFRGAGKLRTRHTADVVDIYLPGTGGRVSDTSGA